VTVLCAAACLILAACSSNANTGPQGYLYSGSDVGAGTKSVQIIQIVHNGSAVSGTSDAVRALIHGKIPPVAFHYAVSGTDDGSHLALTLSGVKGALSFSAGWSGNNLVLDWPELDGTVTKETFYPATIDQYNAAVKALS
jgi:hypothetical protein